MKWSQTKKILVPQKKQAMLMAATAYNIKKLLKFKTNFAKSQAKAWVLSYFENKDTYKSKISHFKEPKL